MKVLDLRCAHDHRFEGWFEGVDEFHAQCERGLVQCPICNDARIARLPSAPHISIAKAREVQKTQATPPALTDQPTAVANAPLDSPNDGHRELETITRVAQVVWLKAVQHVIENTDDVGDRFAEEARRIHYGEADERAIRGHASAQDAQALRDEGIDIATLAIPDAFKGTLQ